jgi:hypothetical protein
MNSDYYTIIIANTKNIEYFLTLVLYFSFTINFVTVMLNFEVTVPWFVPIHFLILKTGGVKTCLTQKYRIEIVLQCLTIWTVSRSVLNPGVMAIQ